MRLIAIQAFLLPLLLLVTIFPKKIVGVLAVLLPQTLLHWVLSIFNNLPGILPDLPPPKPLAPDPLPASLIYFLRPFSTFFALEKHLRVLLFCLFLPQEPEPDSSAPRRKVILTLLYALAFLTSRILPPPLSKPLLTELFQFFTRLHTLPHILTDNIVQRLTQTLLKLSHTLRLPKNLPDKWCPRLHVLFKGLH